MALNVTQVNQAFLGLLGRPATGAEAAKFAGQLDAATLAQTLLTDASFKNELSVETLSFKTVDLLNTDPAAFVESLYTALLGRASDAEGKAFWLSVAGATPNRADVVSQFIAAVQAQEGTADANAFASIQAEDKALASAWVESLYNNLAGRASDAEGLDFWTNAIVSFTMTPAQVAASFAAALALQGNTTEDGQNYLAKLGVADNFTANFKDFNALVTANEKAEQLKNLVTMMNGVNKDSQVDQYVEEITKNVNEFQNIKAIQFTTSDEDELGIDPETGESNLTGAANFTGTYNLTDAAKGTIQSSDSATGTEAYLTDTLTINVTGYDKTTHADFDLGELPNTSSVEKLVINNGAANVNDGNGGTGSIDGDFEYINVNGTGSFKISASTNSKDGFKDISLNSAANKDEQNVFDTNEVVKSIKTGAGNDVLTLGTVTKSLSTGAGDDIVGATLGEKATADLGAGDDTFTGYLGQAASLNGGAGDDTLNVTSVSFKKDKKGNPISDITIDGGTGNDKLVLDNGVDFIDYQNIKTIKGVESLTVGNGTKLVSSAISGQKIELSGTSLVLNAKGANGVDLSKLSNAENQNVEIRVENVESGLISLETGDKNFSAIKETIVLSKTASKVTIKGFEKANDHIEIEGVRNSKSTIDDLTVIGTVNNPTTLLADNIYGVDSSYSVSTVKAINEFLKNAGYVDAAGKVNTGLKEGDDLFFLSYDTAGEKSNAKLFKYKVGKDGSISKVDQMATINVADKKALDITSDDIATNPDYVVTANVEVDNAGKVTVNIDQEAFAQSGSIKVNLANTPVSSVDFSSVTGNVANIEIAGLKAATAGTPVDLVLADNINVTNLKVDGSTPVSLDLTTTAGTTIDTITTTAGADVITASADQVKEINAGAGDDTIDLSSTSGTATGITTVIGGTGTDTLVLKDAAAEKLVKMLGVEKIELKGTSINADAITTNASSGVARTELAKLAGTGVLEVKAGDLSTINLANLVQATGDSGDVSLKVTGLKDNYSVNLTKLGNTKDTNAFTETVEIGTGVKNITVNNIATNDIVKAADLTGVSGAVTALYAQKGVAVVNGFDELKADAANVAANKAYFTNSALSTTLVKAIQGKLGTGEKVAIAVNENNGSKLYLVGKTGDATLIANLSDKIDSLDTMVDGVVTFNTTNSGTPEANTVPLAYGTNALNLSTGKYDTTNFTAYDKLVVKDISGAGLTISGGKNDVDAVITGESGAVTVDSTATGTVNVYLGGSVDVNGKITASSSPVDLSGVANAEIAKGAKALYANVSGNTITLKDASKFGGTDANPLKLDLSKVNAQITISGGVTATTDLNDLFVSGDANDTITFTISGGTSDNTIKGTAAAEILTVDSGASAKSVDLGAGIDTIVLSGDATSVTSLKNVEKISLSNDASLSLAALNDNITSLGTTELKFGASASGKALTLDASGATTIDLSQVTKDTEATSGASITLDKVGSGATTDVAITLNKDDNITETINLKNLADGKKVTINGFVTNSDKLNLASGASVTSIGSDTKLNDGSEHVLIGSAINSVANIIGSDGKAASELVSAFSAATAAFSTSGQTGYIAQVKDNKTYLYEITNDGSSSAEIDAKDTVKLIATFDVSNLVATDFVNA